MINPKQIKKLMKNMNVEQIEAARVIIKTPEKDLVIENPQVSKMDLMGQETYQIVGSAVEREPGEEDDTAEADVEMIMDQTGVDAEAARTALESAGGDLAKAIVDVKDTNS